MPGSRPQPLLLSADPAAVLLLDLPADGAGPAAVAAADDAATRLAASAPAGEVPVDLPSFCRAAGLPAGVAERALDGRVPGELVAGRWWLTVAPVAAGRALLALHGAAAAAGGPGAGPEPVAATAGAALTAVPARVAGGAPDGVVDGVVEWADSGWSRVTGVPGTDVVGRDCSGLLVAVGEAPPALRGAARTGEPADATLLGERPDGTRFLHRVRVTPLRDRTGAVRHVVTWHEDVTARPGDPLPDLLREVDALGGPVPTRETVAAGLGAAVRTLAREVVPAALVALVDDGPARAAGGGAEVVAAAGEPFEPLVGRVWRRPPGARADDPLLHPPAPGGPALLALDGGDPAAPSGWLAELTRAAGPDVRVLPLPGHGHVLGWLVVLPGGAGPADEAVLRAAALRTGLAVENARLRAREHELSETLQRSMLPEDTAVEGLDVWAFYAPNADHAQVGGDWYDVFQAADGSAGVVIGDVVGHDVEAVAAMGQMRSVVRSAAQELDDPGSVLMRVDQLAAGVGVSRMASLVYATLQRLDDGGWEVAWSSAGHLPPLLRRADAGGGPAVEVLNDATGTLVGLGERPRPTRERALRPGDVLVLYTDGLIEARHRPMRDGMEVLVEVLAGTRAGDAAGVGEELLQGLGESPEDDTAIVVVRVPEEAEGAPQRVADTPRRRRWQLPSEPSSVGKARHATLRACAVWGLGVGPQAEIVVSELVANAVLHGWGPVGLRLFDLPGALRVEVEDDSPEQPRVVDARPDGSGGHGMRVVATLGRWGTTPTRRGKIVWVEIPTTAPAAPAAPREEHP
ncbi:SpoIIE family protein phosphatase [Paenibacillus sp. TRM 82003]|uniref:ATP-binding SpoIIE family protein phosphatase n=1 Tax=Kineococcus sp. TRM81007 TaxID=2925831 RepID=UPI001F57FA67|nr:SpoIIE family protein phosphatase [Kineococcus sp. TRM81007]MCI2237175.1 SpoIIE family protein phosphatase [Kineococcus sp. TRM81007]MCI3925296.1 SpoIIE family protein phosphatase [Paenibacillus sp. TRM 82003]